MAQLRDTVVSGSLRATDTIYTTTAQFQILRAPITSGGSTYGPGTNGNFLKSNGTSVYWTNLSTSDIPTGISITGNAANVTGTVALDHGGTGSTTATGARSNLGLGNAKIFYGICSTAAGTVAKEVECADFSAEELKSGAAILVTFTQTNSGAVGSLTMNVNNTGAKALKKQYNTSAGNLTSAAELITGNTYLFVYNSTYSSNAGAWMLMTADYNSTYDMAQLYSAEGASRTMETAANGGLGSHLACLQMMTKNQTWSAISAVSGSTASNQGTAVAKIASTADFLLNSPILYVSNNTYVAPGSSANINGYTSFCVNLQYSIGTTSTAVALTFQKPVYLVGKVNSDGATFKLDATQWWTQDLPTSNDGKIYIFLGLACSVSNIYLYTHHPIYYHNGTTVKVYNPGIHLQDETLLTNDGNEYVSVSDVSEISIPDAAASNIKNGIISIKPAQDLNGYDAPWAPGANKNMLDATFDSGTNNGITYTVAKTSDGYVKSVTINGTVGSTNSRWGGEVHLKAGTYILSGCPAGGANATYNITIRNGGLSASVIGNVDMGDGATITLANDGTYYLTIVVNANLTVNNLTFYPMLRLSSITDSTFVPYSNICPISGWTMAEITTRYGKNLLNDNDLENGYISENGNFVADTSYKLTNYIAVDSGKSYVFSLYHNGAAQNKRVHGYDADKNWVSQLGVISTGTTSAPSQKAVSFTIAENVKYIRIGSLVPAMDTNMQLELGSAATDYEPCKSRIFPISFPSSAGIVYGGTIDLDKGKLVVDRVKTTLSDKTFGTRQTSTLPAGGFIPISTFSLAIDISIAPISDMLLGTTYEDRGADGTISPNTSTSTLYLFTSHTVEEAQALYSNATIIYSLATPLEYDISVPPITLFNGLNNLWLNCGTMSFNYQTNIYPVSLDKSGNLAVQVSLDNNESNYILSSNVRSTVYKKYESTNFYGTSNNAATCTFFFMSVRPDEWYKPWRVRFKVHSYCPAYPNNHSVTYCTLSGRLSSSIYSNWNDYINAAHYYIGVMMLNEAGYNNGLGHAVGIDLRNSTYFNNSAYYRTFEVEYYDCDGCTVSFLDEPVLQANWPNYNTTNYGAINEYNAVDRGLQETGDANTHDCLELYGTSLVTSSTFRLGGYTLFGFDNNNRAQGISLYSTDYASSTTSINTARSYNTAGIDYTRGLYYFDNNTNRAKNTNVSAIVNDLVKSAIDFRYTDNCVASSTANALGMVQFKHVYLRGVIKEDGLFYLRPLSVTYNNATYQRAWTQDIPTSVETDGTYPYVYWLIGRPYYDYSYAASLYRVSLEMHNPVYWYHNGAFREYQKWPTYDIQYTSTTPTTRADGVSALQEGDIWFKPVS